MVLKGYMMKNHIVTNETKRVDFMNKKQLAAKRMVDGENIHDNFDAILKCYEIMLNIQSR